MKIILILSFVLIFSLPEYILSQNSENSNGSFNQITFTGALNFGYSVSEAGDLNNDDYDDIAVGNGQNSIRIYLGSNIPDTTTDIVLFFNNPSTSADVSGGGDINGDGFDDLLVGVLPDAFVFFGGVTMDSIPDLILHLNKLSTFGYSPSGNCNLNGDEFSDFMVSDEVFDITCIYFGGADLDSIPDLLIPFYDRGPGQKAGDINNDGFDDIIAHNFIYYGGIGMDSIPDVSLNLLTGYLTNVSAAGDVNGDGFDDIIISDAIINSFTGKVFLYYGGVNMNPFPSLTFSGTAPSQYYGINLSSCGDFDNDGFDDIMIAGRNDANLVNIYRGGPQMDSMVDHHLTGEGFFGFAVSEAGDFNGDGNDDFIIGAPYLHMPFSGAAYLYAFESRSKLVLNLFLQSFYNSESNSQISDTVNVYLRSTASPYASVDSVKLFLSQNGTDTLNFSNVPSGNYYIVVKHRNSVETWSKSGGEFFDPQQTTFYDFTSFASQAFGNNLTQVDSDPLRFAIYGGNANQDRIVDLSDLINILNDVNNFVTGYVNTDINGDNIVDETDMLRAYNNSVNFITCVTP